MKVGSRLAIGFFLVILCIWAIILLTRDTFTKMHQGVELLKEDIVSGTIVMAEMHRTAVEIAHEVMEYTVYSEEETKGQLLSSIEYIKKLGIEHVQSERHLGQEHQKAAEKVMMLTNGMTSQVEEIIRLKDDGLNVDELLKREMETVHKPVAVLSKGLTKQTRDYREELAKTVEAVHEAHTSGLRFLVLLAAVVTLLIVAVSWFITRSIVKPLHALEKGTELIGQGNLDYRVGTNVQDEIGELSRAFDQMTRQLQRSTVSIGSLEKEVSDRKRAEDALKAEKHEKEMILDSLVEHVVYQNLENQVLWANQAACESVHKTREALVGQHCYEIWAGRQSVCDDCPVAKALNTGDPQSIEKTTPDGRSWYIQGYPVRGIKRDIVGIVELVLDITERRKAEEETRKLEAKLVQAQKLEAIGTLAGGIAHDFNNVLMGIQGNASLMFLDIDTEHPHYELLKSVEKQVQSGARLTSHLLGYARKGNYEVKPIDLKHLVAEISESFGRTRRDISIHRQLNEELFGIEGDSGQIEQVLWNLFVNAADAMPGGGDLILKTDNLTHEDMKGKLYDPKPGSYVLLTVADTGLGMDKQTIGRIFDPFFTTKEMGRGTGLGLASAYGIIKAHAGYIDVESQKGVGTTFSIYLPSSEKMVQKVVKAAQEVIGGTETVLLIDDEEVVLEVGKNFLEAMGYRVLTARDGKEAIEIYKKNRDKIDLVILDMVMPHMGGGEAYDKMKEISPNVKVLLSSGYSIDGQATEILQRGCNGFIQKPFTIKRLSQAIREVLGAE